MDTKTPEYFNTHKVPDSEVFKLRQVFFNEEL